MSLVKLALLLLVATVGASYETSAMTSGRSARYSATHAPLVSRGSLSAPRQTLLRLRGGVRELEDLDEWEALHEEVGDKLLVVDFTAVWCGPCQRIAPAFAALAEEYADSAHFVKVDVDKLGELAAQLGVTSMPTFLFMRNGEVVDRMSGADEAGLRAMVAELSAVPAAAA